MIDKELIRQAAEDIDLFEDDLSAEFDRMCQPKRRPIRLWPYVAAACIAFAVIFTSIQLFEGKQETTDQRITSQTEQSPHPDVLPVDKSRGEDITVAKDERASHAVTPTAQTLAAASADSQKTKEAEEDEYSEELLYALITEVEAKARAEEEAKEDRLCRTLIEEISTNITKQSNQSNQSELTL